MASVDGPCREAFRYGLGEHRSFGNKWIMLVAMIVIDVVSPRLRGWVGLRQPAEDDESGWH